MITVYWCASMGSGGVRANQPKPALQLGTKHRDSIEVEYLRCPAFRDSFHNIVGLSSYYSYKLTHQPDGSLDTDMHDQTFYENNVKPRSAKEQLLSFYMPYILFTEEPSLLATITPSYYEDNKFNSSSILIPGSLDIGKYFRNLECAFHIRKGLNTMEIEEGDIYMYVNFNTTQKVEFKEFLWTTQLDEYLRTVLESKQYRAKNFKPLNYFYNIFSRLGLKKRIITEIKNNLCEG